MAVTVRLFAALRDAAGTARIDVEPGSVAAIVDGLRVRFGEPFATRVTVASGMLDGHRVSLDEPIDVPDGAELALLPPFSGGATATAQRRRGRLLLLAGSLLVPLLLIVGFVTSREAFGLVVIVVAVGTIVDLQTVLAATGARPMLPAALLLGVGPATLLTLAPAVGLRWVGGLIAVGVMFSFLLAFAAPRRHEAADAVGATLLAGLIVGLGAGSLMILYGAVDTATGAGALAVIAVTDVAVILVDDGTTPGRMWWRLLVAPAVAAVGAGVLSIVAPGPQAPALLAGLAVAAVFGALLGARLQDVVRRHGRGVRPANALLVGTADAVLLGAPVALVSVQVLAG